MTQQNTQNDTFNKSPLQKRMRSEFKKAALGATLILTSTAPFLAGMETIWDLRAAVTAEQIAAAPSYGASLKSCKNSNLPGKDTEILDCASKRTRQNIISATAEFKNALPLVIGGFTGMAAGLLWSVASAGAAFDARRKYRGNTPA